MNLKDLEDSVETITNDLKDVEEKRDKLIKESRDVISLCSKSIVAIHSGNFDSASEKIDDAKKLLGELRESAGNRDLYRYLIPAETELVEAYSLSQIIRGSDIPDLNSIGVKGDSYILGLLDCIGELKRLVFDKIRDARNDEAQRFFTIMEDIYTLLYPLAVYDNIVKGVRKKLDVAKRLIEDTRATVTEDKRRIAILESINRLQEKLSDSG